MRSRPGHYLLQVIVVALGLSLAGCAALTGGKSDSRLEGTVWYKERMLLPPDAQIEVMLEDVSKADAPSTSIASTSFKAKGSPPWDFVLTYDPDLIKERNRYNLRAKITHKDKALFVSTSANPVFRADDSSGNHRILVSGVDAAFADAKASPPSSDRGLAGVSWQLSWIDGETIDTNKASKPLNIVFVDDDDQAHGYSGCNSFTGGYSQSGKQLMFNTLAVTSMACAEGMEREQIFLKALNKTTELQIRDGELTLLDEDGDQVLQFEAGTAK